jgi:hypothetical protein
VLTVCVLTVGVVIGDSRDRLYGFGSVTGDRDGTHRPQRLTWRGQACTWDIAGHADDAVRVSRAASRPCRPRRRPTTPGAWPIQSSTPLYSALLAHRSGLLRMHAGNRDMADLGPRFVDCFVAAADDARPPDDPSSGRRSGAYLEWP